VHKIWSWTLLNCRWAFNYGYSFLCFIAKLCRKWVYLQKKANGNFFKTIFQNHVVWSCQKNFNRSPELIKLVLKLFPYHSCYFFLHLHKKSNHKTQINITKTFRSGDQTQNFFLFHCQSTVHHLLLPLQHSHIYYDM